MGLVLQDYKMSQIQVPAEFFPTNVICCLCLAVYINEIFNANIREYLRILKAIIYNKMMPEHVFSALTEQNQSSIIVCAYHLEEFLDARTKYFCTPKEGEGGFWFEGLDRGYCLHCIKHCMKKMTKICSYKIFN